MIETHGSKAPMKTAGSMEHDGASSGKIETHGSKVPATFTPESNMPFKKGNTGSIETHGSKAPASYEPIKGWTSHPTPMSERAVKQSK